MFFLLKNKKETLILRHEFFHFFDFMLNFPLEIWALVQISFYLYKTERVVKW